MNKQVNAVDALGAIDEILSTPDSSIMVENFDEAMELAEKCEALGYKWYDGRMPTRVVPYIRRQKFPFFFTKFDGVSIWFWFGTGPISDNAMPYREIGCTDLTGLRFHC